MFRYMRNMDMAFIDQLSSEEREELLTALAYQQQRVPGAARREQHSTLWLLLCDVSKQRRSLDEFLKAYGKQKYADREQELESFLHAALPPVTRRPVRDSIREASLRCLANELRARSIPVTPGSLLNSFSMLEYAVDRWYPGYISAGLLHRVVAQAA